jgi:hypothetical protein
MATVSGIVRDAQGNPAPGLAITARYKRQLVGYDGGAVYQDNRVFTTDETGLLVMEDLVPGYYDLIVIVPLEPQKIASMTVLDVEAMTLQEAMGTDVADITPTIAQQAIAAKDAAEAAADDAVGYADAAAASATLADAARIAAEAARDSSFANAKGADTIANARALVADTETFIVYAAGAETFDAYRRLTSTTQQFLGTYPSAALVQGIQAHVVEPFPAQDWATPLPLNLLATPASGTTYQQQTFTVASAGRFYAVPTIASLGLAVGDFVRVAFRRVSGTGQPTAFTFRAGTTLVSTVNFVLRGGWWIAEAEIPATTTIIRIDWTNGTGADVVFTRPAFSRRLAFQRLGHADRLRLAGLASDPGGLGNLFPANVTVLKLAGTGDLADVVIGSGQVTFPADFQGSITGANINRPVGAVMTVLARSSGPLIGMQARFVGATTGTQAVSMSPVGDGWWLLQGHTIAIGGSTAINAIRFEPDNRNGTGSLFVSAPVTIDRLIVVDGASIPARLPSPAPDIFPDSEVILTQSSGQLLIAHRAGPDKYARWQFDRYDTPADRALGWRIRGLDSVLRTGDLTFGSAVPLAYTGEHETAIREDGKTDFMGGATHGDQEETRALTLLIDGKQVTPDGVTSYRARQIECIQRSELLEVDNATRTVTARLTTRWLWRDNQLILDQHLEWVRSINVLACYLGMWSLLRGGVTDTARVSPAYDPVDVSTQPHASPAGNFQRLTQSGPLGGFDMKAIKGWNTFAGNPSRALVQDAPAGNKLYFAPFRFTPATAVTAGDVIEFATRYRVGLT